MQYSTYLTMNQIKDKTVKDKYLRKHNHDGQMLKPWLGKWIAFRNSVFIIKCALAPPKTLYG